MKKTIIALLTLACLVPFSAAAQLAKAGETTELFAGFEGKSPISAVKNIWNDKDCSTDTKASKEFATEGASSLACLFTMSERGVATFNAEGFKPSNWTQFKGIGLDMKNGTDQDLKIVIAVCVGDDWKWMEADFVDLKAGQTRKDVRWDFGAKVWGASYENYATVSGTSISHKDALSGHRSTNRFSIRVYGDKGVSGAVFIDHIRHVK